MRKQLSPILFLFTVFSLVALACNGSAAATPTETPRPSATASATATPTRTPSPTVTFTPTVTPTDVPVQVKYLLKIEKGHSEPVGNDAGVSVVYDRTSKTVGLVASGDRFTVFGPADLEVTVFQSDMLTMSSLAVKAYPQATTKFWGKPTFAPSAQWTAILPKGWQPLIIADRLRQRNDFWQETVGDPRAEDLAWTVTQVTCKRYEKDPGNLPAGIDYRKPQVFQLLVLNYSISLKVVCGNRVDGIQSAWALRYSFLNQSQNWAARAELMADALTWMLSPSGKPAKQGVNMQDFYLFQATNFGRYIIGAEGIFGWQTAPESFLGKGG